MARAASSGMPELDGLGVLGDDIATGPDQLDVDVISAGRKRRTGRTGNVELAALFIGSNAGDRTDIARHHFEG